jgi:hypothetical protein
VNLHNVVAGIVSAVNPILSAQYQRSSGYTIAPDGTRASGYAPGQTVAVQKQPLQSNELQQIQGLNINGEKAGMYVSGDWDGVSRADARGGDLITLPNGDVWMVVQILENWFDTARWVKATCVKQNRA